MKLRTRAVRNAVFGLIILGIVIFGSAGTLAYWQGWAFIMVFAAATGIISADLALKDPALLERRIEAGPWAETRPVQKVLISAACAGLYALAVVAVLDHRFGWTYVPAWVSVIGNLLVVLGLAIVLRVFRENSYGASTIKRMEGQKVISTGPYAVVRHPMYAGALTMLAGVPLALGSYWGLAIMVLNVPILMLRILDEEAMLRLELDGYIEYVRSVHYRLLPGLW